MRKILLVTLVQILFSALAFSQADKFWSVNVEDRNNISKDKAVGRLSFPANFRLFNLNLEPLTKELLSVVDRSSKHSTVISLPNANGGIEEFEVYEASNFDTELQARFPEIRAYSGRGITDKYATVKLSISPVGVQTMVFRTGLENEFIEPYSDDHRVYSVFRSNRDKGKLSWTCTTEEKKLTSAISSAVTSRIEATGISTGELKTMRLAQSCNAEYSNYFGATSSAQVGLVLAAYNATLTRCNGVYEKDLALHLNLISNTTSVIYYNPATDPYSRNMSSWNNQLQSTLNSVIGDGNYDIGHMFGASGGGGNAGCIGCVCGNGKGSGITSPADGIPEGDNFDIDYVIHEVGHQLGANHTFSMSNEGTGQNKEIGSGITIMGYAGITAQDVAPHSIAIFHETSIAQIQANLATKTCPISISANNSAPIIAAVSNYTIPISTPFVLSGSATDPESDILTYCWEQNDNSTTSGASSVASPTKATGPNWISFSPSVSGTRTFPKLATILAGLNVSGPLPGGDAGANTEALSSVARTLNFRLTVRDNHPYIAGSTIGQTAFTDVAVSVTNSAGPFAVTSPNTNITWNIGSTATVTWSVNNTDAAPVSCSNVNILISTDGGNNFTTLLANTPNDGSEEVAVPNTPGTTNRIKVESVGNIFFDISNTNFKIGSAAACGDPTGLTNTPATETSTTVSWNAVVSANSYDVEYKKNTDIGWTIAVTGTSATSVNLSGLTAGTFYYWHVRANCTGGSGNYVQANFTTAAPPTCGSPTGLSSTTPTQTTTTVNWTAVASAISYDVEYKKNSDLGWTIAATGTSATSVNLSGLTAGTSYIWHVRANCSGGSSSYIQANFTTASSGSPCPGSLDVSSNGTTGGAATIPFNTDVYGLINVKGDIDHYKFVITTGGTITITLNTLPADYQLALLNNAGTVLQSSLNNGTVSESINNVNVSAGTYYVKVYPKTNGAFNASSCYTLRVQTVTANKAVNSELVKLTTRKFSVFPNPASSDANLAFISGINGTAIVSVFDQSGSVVLRKTISVNKGENFRKLNVSSLIKGMYYIKIQNGTFVETAKIIIGN